MNLGQSAQVKSQPQTCFSWFLLSPRTSTLLINQSPATYAPTHRPLTYRPLTQRLAESINMFEWPENKKNNHLAEHRTHNYTLIFYPKSTLVSIKHIPRSQLYLFFQFLSFNALLLPRYFKVAVYSWVVVFFSS